MKYRELRKEIHSKVSELDTKHYLMREYGFVCYCPLGYDFLEDRSLLLGVLWVIILFSMKDFFKAVGLVTSVTVVLGMLAFMYGHLCLANYIYRRFRLRDEKGCVTIAFYTQKILDEINEELNRLNVDYQAFMDELNSEDDPAE